MPLSRQAGAQSFVVPLVVGVVVLLPQAQVCLVTALVVVVAVGVVLLWLCCGRVCGRGRAAGRRVVVVVVLFLSCRGRAGGCGRVAGRPAVVVV